MSTEPTNHEPTEEAEVAQLRARIREIATQTARLAERAAARFAVTGEVTALFAMLDNARLAKELTDDEDEWIRWIRGAAKD